jgi:hypothetical protein
MHIYHNEDVSLLESYGQTDEQIETRNGSKVVHLAGALMLMCQKAFSIDHFLSSIRTIKQSYEQCYVNYASFITIHQPEIENISRVSEIPVSVIICFHNSA